jgi:hypothetical protein
VDVAPYVSYIVRHLPAGYKISVFAFIYMAMAGDYFVYEAKRQVHSLGNGLI